MIRKWSYVSSYSRKNGTLVSGHSKRTGWHRGNDDFTQDERLGIVKCLIEKGLQKNEVSLEYQMLWDAAEAALVLQRWQTTLAALKAKRWRRRISACLKLRRRRRFLRN